MSTLKAIIAPSVLASNISKLAEETQRMESLGAEWIHLDVMDMHFVPNLSFEKYVPLLKTSNQLTFHFEALNEDTERCIQLAKEIRDNNLWCGISIKPKTDVQKLVPLLDTNLINTVLVMTVEPGFGGQSFMHDMMGTSIFNAEDPKYVIDTMRASVQKYLKN
ncbi:D-ribulose-5-phosphate 3-epimerase,putative [Plasmodium sp. gorilla clade G2]|uniref:D-ribulose-5-phosphate 3-epimerase,putative n=1 Tax=Plasmodium sp. gorilla clade G2 TaxID=880535 RepID=UPI000D2EF8A8|nr:D-ribulose-5-phosphate 3-epimerase,putative [Plasmodium sp. gorilla clade G2]SOV19994.1 D-ribulose-5-phosphate 3-epimerase,putative [Plasmodium sp. gorilla clade G2]